MKKKELMLKMVLIRHCETDCADNNIMMGTWDIPPSKEGLAHTTIIKSEINKLIYNKIYSSPLSRALNTALKLFPKVDITIDSNLSSRNLGLWTGKIYDDIKVEYPQAFLKSGYFDPSLTPPGGEPIENMIIRVNEFLKKLLCQYIELAPNNCGLDPHNVAVVTHNGVIRVIRYLFGEIKFYDIFAESEPYLIPLSYLYFGNKWVHRCNTFSKTDISGISIF